MTALEPPRKQRAELVAPEPHRLVGRFELSLGKQIFDVAVAEVEAMFAPARLIRQYSAN
jgi:hypothetical protein